MQDLVDGTGINRGSLYATFGDKRSLFVLALRKYDDAFRGVTLPELEAHASALEAIEGLLRVFAGRLSQPDRISGCFLTNTAVELSTCDAEIGRIVAHAQIQVEAFFDRMIARGQAAGEISDGIDGARVASGLLASLIGLAVLARSRPDPELMDSVVEQAMRALRP